MEGLWIVVEAFLTFDKLILKLYNDDGNYL